MNMLKHIVTGMVIATFTISGSSVTPVFAELPDIDAYQAVLNTDERPDGEDLITSLEMTLINKRGQKRIRQVLTYRRDYEDKTTKMVMFFQEPADVKNTGFLTWNYDEEGKDDDQWLYLPALKKIRRISSSKKKNYFMGTDFTYEDMGDRNINDYTYKHLGTEVIDGIECYHIEMMPKSNDIVKKTGYGRGEMWIRPDNWVGIKTVFYDKKLKLLKELTMSDIEQIDGFWTMKTMTMVNEQKKHTTIFKFSDITYDSGLDDDMFSQRRLTKGIQ